MNAVIDELHRLIVTEAEIITIVAHWDNPHARHAQRQHIAGATDIINRASRALEALVD